MKFNKHPELEGRHAFLGASKYHWLNYDDTKLIETYSKFLQIEKGTKLHEFAAQCINLKQKLPNSKKTLNMYVNDAIRYGMTTEQPLKYSENSFGTADGISYNNNILRIHDYKSGVTPAKMEQLLIYAALFCLEYKVDPIGLAVELRIYQNDEILVFNPTALEIKEVVDNIVSKDKILTKIQLGEAN